MGISNHISLWLFEVDKVLSLLVGLSEPCLEARWTRERPPPLSSSAFLRITVPNARQAGRGSSLQAQQPENLCEVHLPRKSAPDIPHTRQLSRSSVSPGESFPCCNQSHPGSTPLAPPRQHRPPSSQLCTCSGRLEETQGWGPGGLRLGELPFLCTARIK